MICPLVNGFYFEQFSFSWRNANGVPSENALKIKGFMQSGYLAGGRAGNFWHNDCASAEKFWRAWHNPAAKKRR
jgi:hypothetical protein